MPTKVFSALDATVQPGGAPSGLLQRWLGGVSADIAWAAYWTSTGPGSFTTIFFGVAADYQPGIGSHLLSVFGFFGSHFDVNYLATPNQIPEDAKIKKLVYRSPVSWNLQCSYSTSTDSHTEWQIVMRTLFEGALLANRTLAELTEDDITDSFLIGSITGTDADITAFDHIGTETFISRADLILNYTGIQNVFPLNTGTTPPGNYYCKIFPTSGPGSSLLADFNITQGTDWTVTITYEYGSFQYTLVNPPPGRSIESGATLTYTSPVADDALDFTQIETMTLKTYDAENNLLQTFDIPELQWITVEEHDFVFTLPGWTNEPQILVIEITSTQFTGSMELQRAFPVQFYNAPGIYTFVEGETHDTYYDRDSDPISTVETKIPNPTGRTGFY